MAAPWYLTRTQWRLLEPLLQEAGIAATTSTPYGPDSIVHPKDVPGPGGWRVDSD